MENPEGRITYKAATKELTYTRPPFHQIFTVELANAVLDAPEAIRDYLMKHLTEPSRESFLRLAKLDAGIMKRLQALADLREAKAAKDPVEKSKRQLHSAVKDLEASGHLPRTPMHYEVDLVTTDERGTPMAYTKTITVFAEAEIDTYAKSQQAFVTDKRLIPNTKETP
jgi:hypothetical protein